MTPRSPSALLALAQPRALRRHERRRRRPVAEFDLRAQARALEAIYREAAAGKLRVES